MEKSDIMFRVSLVGTTFFDIYNRVKHLKRKLTLRKNGAFGFAFGVQHGLWQKQALIKSKIKSKKKIQLREEKDICNCNNDRVLPKAELSIKNEIKRLLLHRAFGFVFVLNSILDVKNSKIMSRISHRTTGIIPKRLSNEKEKGKKER